MVYKVNVAAYLFKNKSYLFHLDTNLEIDNNVKLVNVQI